MKKYFIGIDLGSRTSKIVILNSSGIVYSDVLDTGINPKITSKKLFEQALKETEIKRSDIGKIYSTGYGRNIVPFSDKRISEISCHAKGVNFFFPKARTIIDIGGQDSKMIMVNDSGKVQDFVMNDRCAAGTGRFLEVTANILECTVDELGKLSFDSQEKIDMNSTCVVFAESEIVGLIAQGKKKEDIINAVHLSVAKRVKNLISQMHWQKPVVFTGGVANNTGMKQVISEILNTDIAVPQNPFLTGALGAAIFAKELYL